ncbi:thylakoid membrane protein TERC, chloroplastic isoform X2 [Selaginella moellendorffii]|uniref:thylakoid membrane protein TERC, chloroplastic isoform X2 n=1 Tax=Selaginella moellendorffii TaxID=88036 RepID=UPI000D1C43B0|nr:thylakoid membrane protein TERC, chloroplastic isoform X2 [Selaginella moellendorffii]|eukprot:XP_024515017.1 thylakoid membrane protein TERC, chloroplastic isoform X2 [Selaginella moellendorffii]
MVATRLSTLRTLLHCMPKDTQDDHNESTEQSIGIVAEKLVEAAAISVSTVGEIEIEDVPVTKPVIEKEAAIKTVVFWVTAAAAFGAFVGVTEGSTKASEFFAGYLLEQSLSVDNLFVFVLIFNYFQVPLQYQSRVLTYGIAGAIVFRATMILLGVATLERFEVVNLLLAAILLFSSYKLLTGSDEENDFSENYIVNTCKRFIPVTPDYDGQKFFTTIDGVRMATPLLLTLAVIELSDIAFAVDSIPAVFGVTRDPFIVFSSNLFAILGLRSLYTLISSSMAELEYLQPAVAAILGFIGAKMVLDFFGLHVPTEVSLGIVATTLGAGVSLSLLRPHDDEQND